MKPLIRTRTIPEGAWPDSEVRDRARVKADPSGRIRTDRVYLGVEVASLLSSDRGAWTPASGIRPSRNITRFHSTFRFWDSGHVMMVARMKCVPGLACVVPIPPQKIDIDDTTSGVVGYYFVDGDDLYIEYLGLRGDKRTYMRYHGVLRDDGSMTIDRWQIVEGRSLDDDQFIGLEHPSELSIIQGRAPQDFDPDW
jgi:hypothetical protein